MMRHNLRFFTFLDAYLNQITKFHLQNVFLKEEIKDQIFQLFTHVSLTHDPRVIRDMVPLEVWTNLPPDPEITKLEEQRAALKVSQYYFDSQENKAEIRKLTIIIQSKRSQHKEQVIKEYHLNYFHHRPTWDLERQTREGK